MPLPLGFDVLDLYSVDSSLVPSRLPRVNSVRSLSLRTDPASSFASLIVFHVELYSPRSPRPSLRPSVLPSFVPSIPRPCGFVLFFTLDFRSSFLTFRVRPPPRFQFRAVLHRLNLIFHLHRTQFEFTHGLFTLQAGVHFGLPHSSFNQLTFTQRLERMRIDLAAFVSPRPTRRDQSPQPALGKWNSPQAWPIQKVTSSPLDSPLSMRGFTRFNFCHSRMFLFYRIFIRR